MEDEPSYLLSEFCFRVLQASARRLWIKPPDWVGWENRSARFCFFPPAVI